jgi:hypothetical protein
MAGTSIKFASPTTNQLFPRTAQLQLRDEAMRRGILGSLSRYWVTPSQAARLCGTRVRSDATPFKVVFGSHHVVAIEDCELKGIQELLQKKPPYFGLGVGIFTDGKWKRVMSPKIVNRLNPRARNRVLYLDADTAQDLGLARTNSTRIAIADSTRIEIYNAVQCENPVLIAPPLGLAINPGVGRRWPQPAHDVLLAAAFILGHVSPYWLTLRQAELLFKVSVTRRENIVSAPTRLGHAVPVDSLTRDMRKRLLTKKPKPDANEHGGVGRLLDVGNWERVDNGKLAEALKRTQFWVTLEELERLRITTAAIVKKSCKARVVDLKEVTQERFINALDTSDPDIVQPRDRSFVIVSGRFVSQPFTDVLVRTAAAREFRSPVWLTLADCARVGVGIRAYEKPVALSTGAGIEEHLYNVEDVIDYEDWLAENPPPESDPTSPCLYLLTWRPILSAGKISMLRSYKRRMALWISSAELAISGLRVKTGAKRYRVLGGRTGRPRQAGDDDGPRRGRLVYNAEQTTDPVRATALSPFYARNKQIM